MDLSAFDFNLPKTLIAQAPARPRDYAKLLVYNRGSGQIKDDYFYNLDKYLPAATTLVLNDSKVEKSRLKFGSTEIFVLETINPTTITALVRPGKKFRVGKTITIAAGKNNLQVETLAADDAIRTLRLSLPIDDRRLNPYRQTPFPPYISSNEALSGQYQTVYAKAPGSKAAPTAGLHFTPKLLKEIAKKHPIAKLTLHVGLATFSPVKTANINDHKLHSEDFWIGSQTAEILNSAKIITAVGTTSLRVLESVARPFKKIAGSTDIFIRPGYEFKAVDSLVTNFHLPMSTLLMLVAAFIGSLDETLKIYDYAVAKKYRFYSFGDAMLVI